MVKNNLDPTRCGRVQVFIPELGGNPDDQANWRTVSYASPFYGTTFGTDTAQNPDTPQTSGQSYGMWMVPPDIGCKVLVLFVYLLRFFKLFESANKHCLFILYVTSKYIIACTSIRQVLLVKSPLHTFLYGEVLHIETK